MTTSRGRRPASQPDLPSILLCLTLLFCGCGKPPATPSADESRVWEVTAPDEELILKIIGKVSHREAESVNAPVEGLRLAWMASEGSLVEEGDVIVRYDTELLELWLRANQEDLAVLERQVRAANLAADANTYELRAKLDDAQADAHATRLAYELSKEQDQAERAILQRELELARESLDDAAEGLDAIKALVALGGTAAAEVQEAMAAYERALARVRIPEIQLREFDRLDGSDDRALLDQDLSRLGLKLEEETQAGSLRSRLAVAVADHQLDRERMELREQQLADSAEDVSEVINDAVYRVESDGVVGGERRHFAGSAIGSRPLAEILSPDQAIIQVTIPEMMREAVRIKGRKGYRVRVRIPSIDDRWLGGQLQSVSLVKQNEQGMKPSYEGQVKLDELPAALSVGAGVECEVRIPVPTGSLAIPRWWATKGFRPLVHLTDGEERRLEAQVAGDWLLVSKGLAVGDRILPPKNTGAGGKVLYSTVDIPEREEVKLKMRDSYRWRVVERADDGTMVEAGEVIARLRRSEKQRVRGNEAELEELKAEAARFLARSNANGQLGNIYMNWQDARIDAEVARLKYLIERRKVDDVGIVQGEVSARLSEIARQQVEDVVRRESASEFAEIRSANQRFRADLDLRVAQLRESQSNLSAIGAANFRKSVALWTARQNWQLRQAVADKAEQAYRRAQNTHRNKLAVAESAYEKAMLEVEILRNDATQGTVTAPLSGRLFHNNMGWNSIDVGDRITHRHLFNIPTSTKRDFIVHLPARLYRDFQIGDDLTFYLPATGMKRYRGTIAHIADFFEKRDPNRSGYARNRHTVVTGEAETEPTVRMRVEFVADSINSIPPGMTVVVELEAG